MSMSIPILFLIIVLLIAAISDVRFHKIPNWLTYSAMAGAVIYHTSVKGFGGFLFSGGGLGVGIFILIVPFFMGGMGAGEVKLLGAVGGLLGPEGVLTSFLFAAIIGGIYALTLLGFHGFLKEWTERHWAILKALIFRKDLIYSPLPARPEKLKLCYGLVIGLGTLISLI